MLRRFDIAAKAGINEANWDRLVDADLALAAEQQDNADNDDVQAKDRPVQQAIDLDYPMYVLPGEYTVRINLGGESAEATLNVKAPSAFRSRAQAKPELRGRK